MIVFTEGKLFMFLQANLEGMRCFFEATMIQTYDPDCSVDIFFDILPKTDSIGMIICSAKIGELEDIQQE